MTDHRKPWAVFAATLFLLLFALVRHGILPAEAKRISDIRGTKHNLSSIPDGTATPSGGTVPTRNIKATSETQICVFCHTPHAATSGATPLWNRRIAGSGYTAAYINYTSSTLDATQVQGALTGPGGSSKLCLSCHDGLVAIGNVNVVNGVASGGANASVQSIAMTGGTTMPTGAGADTGYTRLLGEDLTNDHPISVSYNSVLATRDGELHTPGVLTYTGPFQIEPLVDLRTGGPGGVRPKLPLEATGTAGQNLAQIQCVTCHDPHIRDDVATKGNQKFLRLNRFQEKNPPSSGSNSANTFDASDTGDIICLACHNKNNGTGAWAFSAHANPAVANELYSSGANSPGDRREFPTNLPVWQAACLNCHDTHTVKGARRLLREGTNEGTPTLSVGKAGGTNTAALEETCYQCHDGGANGTLTSSAEVPNIKADFQLNRRMPIITAAQGTSGGGGGNASEPHDIASNFTDSIFIDCTISGSACGKDFIESRAKLGVGGVTNLKNRHVECTDCHNPHRVIRAARGLPGALNAGNTAATRVNGASGGHHAHTDAAGYTHTNVISGVLRGSWGVEPQYGSASFQNVPTGYLVKRGDPGNANVADCHGANKTGCDNAAYVTREYQICLKCHSDYGFTDDNVYPSGTARPQLGGTNLTPTTAVTPRTNYTRYTNQAKEFQAPSTHRAKPTTTADSGSGTAYQTNNYRAWHPVLDNTGRTGSLRGNGTDISSNWNAPWNNAVGTQTMYCTDCHGSATANTTVIPTNFNPWGPHGSGNDFILKGTYNAATGSTADGTNGLCFRCHRPGTYRGDSETRSGFYIGRGSRGTGKDGHATHYSKLGNNPLKCNWCHVAVPHGWKNKSFLVNLNDVGAEAGQAAGTVVAGPYNNGPYYRNSMLRINVFGPSGNWAIGDCGNPGNTDDQARSWMQGSCNSPP